MEDRPVIASDETAPETETIFKNVFDTERYQKNMKNARIWLYVIAGFQFIMGIVEYNREADSLIASIALGFQSFIAVSFLILALWSRKNPVPAFTTALVLFILFVVGFMLLDNSNILRGILIKILAIIALVKANRDARKYEEIRSFSKN